MNSNESHVAPHSGSSTQDAIRKKRDPLDTESGLQAFNLKQKNIEATRQAQQEQPAEDDYEPGVSHFVIGKKSGNYKVFQIPAGDYTHRTEPLPGGYHYIPGGGFHTDLVEAERAREKLRAISMNALAVIIRGRFLGEPQLIEDRKQWAKEWNTSFWTGTIRLPFPPIKFS